MDFSAMERARKLEIHEWHKPSHQIPLNARRRREWLSHKCVAFLSALALHGLALQVAQFGMTPKTKAPKVESSATSYSKSKDSESLELMNLLPPSPLDSSIAIDGLSRTELASKIPVTLNLSFPSFPSASLPLSEERMQSSAEGQGDAQDKARLFGIYTGQIQARIERVWRRPRTAVNKMARGALRDAGDGFQCQAQIVQDARGNVQEILLPECDESPAWQHSLVVAIQQASPLPAPPSESVFTRSIVLSFVGVPFLPGSPEEEYALPPRDLVSVSQ